MSGFNTKEKNNNGEYEITFYTNNYGEFKTVETLCQNIIGHEKPNSKGDLISRSEVEKLGATCLAKRNEKGQLEAIISLDNAPTVDITQIYYNGFTDGKELSKKPQGEWIPVSERLPEERKAVLIWCPERKNIYCACLEENQWWIFGAYFQKVESEVVAWQPLPESYKKGDTE